MSSSQAKLVAWLAAGTILAGAASRARGQAAPSGYEANAAAHAPNLSLQYPPSEDDGSGLMQSEMTSRGWGGAQMDEYGLKLTGYIEGGYNYNVNTPKDDSNGWGFLFADEAQDWQLNQWELKLERTIPYSADRFDIGFVVEAIYGSDVRYLQANGSNFYGSGFAGERDLTFFAAPFDNVVSSVGFPGQPDPKNQIAFIQAAATMNLPVGNGVMLTGGKIATPWGYETYNPTESPFYTHSYIYSLSTPKTLTGLMAGYQFDEKWSAMGGIVVGWDQAFKDNNDAPSYFLQGTYTSEDNWSVQASTIFGPEETDDSGDWRWMLDVVARWNWQVYDFGVEGVIGYESDISTPRQNIPLQTGGLGTFQVFEGDGAWWYGGAAYGGMYIDSAKRFYLQARAEFFIDNDGARLLSTNVYEATIGLRIVPFVHDRIGQNLMIRPEVRYDYSDDEVFDGGTSTNQIVFAIDAIFKY